MRLYKRQETLIKRHHNKIAINSLWSQPLKVNLSYLILIIEKLNGLTLPINNEASKTQIGDTMTPKSPPRRQKSIYVKGKILV